MGCVHVDRNRIIGTHVSIGVLSYDLLIVIEIKTYEKNLIWYPLVRLETKPVSLKHFL